MSVTVVEDNTDEWLRQFHSAIELITPFPREGTDAKGGALSLFKTYFNGRLL